MNLKLRCIYKVMVAALLLALGGQSSASTGTLRIGDPAPKIDGSEWINSQRLTMNDLSGRVVLIEFWTYG